MGITAFAVFLLLFASGTHTASAATIQKFGTTTTSLVGWWTLDEGTSTIANDFSGNGNQGTFSGTGGPTWVTGKRGHALRFDGQDTTNNQTVLIAAGATNPELAILGDMTVSAWIKPSSSFFDTSEAAVRAGQGGDEDYSIFFNASTNKISMEWFDGAFKTISSGNNVVPFDKWSLVTIVRSGTTGNIYVNGVLVGSAAVTAPTVAASQVSIGRDNNVGVGQDFSGMIDDVRVYNIALSAGDAAALYKSGETVRKLSNNNGLIGYWPLDEGTSTTVGDFSANGSTGTLTNAAWIAGKRGKALDFTGGGYLNIPVSNATYARYPITFTFWAKTSVNGFKSLIKRVTNNGSQTFPQGLNILIDSAHSLGLRADTTGGSNQFLYPVSTAIDDNRWHHLAVTITAGGTVTLYTDASSTGSRIISLIDGTAGDFGFPSGNDSGLGTGVSTNAQIDDVRIFNRALSADEIATIYKSNQTKINAPENSRTTNGLMGFWTFNGQDMTSTNALDVSGNGNHAALTNAPTLAIGKVGQAELFNGTSNVLTVTAASTLDVALGGSVTISAWIKRSVDAPGYETIVSKRGATTNYELSLNTSSTGGAKALIFYSGGGITLSTTLVPVGEWVHVASVTTASQTTYYVNGVPAGTTGAVAGAPNANNLLIGQVAGQFFRGSIDELRLYNRALSAAEIQQLYLMGK